MVNHALNEKDFIDPYTKSLLQQIKLIKISAQFIVQLIDFALFVVFNIGLRDIHILFNQEILRNQLLNKSL